MLRPARHRMTAHRTIRVISTVPDADMKAFRTAITPTTWSVDTCTALAATTATTTALSASSSRQLGKSIEGGSASAPFCIGRLLRSVAVFARLLAHGLASLALISAALQATYLGI